MRDLFSRLEPACGGCKHFGEPINPGVAYCYGELTWRRADDQVPGCTYRDRTIPRRGPPTGTRADALRDLLEDPRHSIDAKGRAWLRAELRRETRSQDGAAEQSALPREAPISSNQTEGVKL